jgi:hypothetical protein
VPGWRDDFGCSKGDNLGIKSTCFENSTICDRVSVLNKYISRRILTSEENKGREKYASKIAEE